MKRIEFVFYYVQLLYYKSHNTNLNDGGLYLHFLDWIKNRKWTINSVDKKDNKCFKYPVTVALSYENMEKHSC